jgi:hypothetical protein
VTKRHAPWGVASRFLPRLRNRVPTGEGNALALARESRGRSRHERWRDPAAPLDGYAVAQQLNPKSDTLHHRRAIAYHASQNYPAAEAEFTTAYERNPDFPNLLARWIGSSRPREAR